MSSRKSGWIGVDLDGTLARDVGWRGEDHIGEPIPEMIERVKGWIEEGFDVRIFTARVGTGAGFSPVSQAEDTQEFADAQRQLIGAWCVEHLGKLLPVTAQKDWAMIEFWDDRAVQVIPNSGSTIEAFWKDAFQALIKISGITDENLGNR